jgi:hypothetical protein
VGDQGALYLFLESLHYLCLWNLGLRGSALRSDLSRPHVAKLGCGVGAAAARPAGSLEPGASLSGPAFPSK